MEPKLHLHSFNTVCPFGLSAETNTSSRSESGSEESGSGSESEESNEESESDEEEKDREEEKTKKKKKVDMSKLKKPESAERSDSFLQTADVTVARFYLCTYGL